MTFTLAERVAAAGSMMIDAPVSGGVSRNDGTGKPIRRPACSP